MVPSSLTSTWPVLSIRGVVYAAAVTLTRFCWHHPRLSPLGNNLRTALRGFPQHVRLFVTRRAPGSAGAELQTWADLVQKVKRKFDGVSYSSGMMHGLDDQAGGEWGI